MAWYLYKFTFVQIGIFRFRGMELRRESEGDREHPIMGGGDAEPGYRDEYAGSNERPALLK